MVNYCLDYYNMWSNECYTAVYSSEEGRSHMASELLSSGNFSITGVYEDEECYCYAYSESECGCGNFKLWS